jgi:hypothetical protein
MRTWNIPMVLKRMLETLLVLSPLLLIALPFIFASLDQDTVRMHVSSDANNRWVTLAFIEICGVFCWVILLMLQKLLATIIRTSPFVSDNVRHLKMISYMCAATAFVLVVKSFLDFSILTPVVAILALLASLFCQTLAAVFDKAITLKDENDLTI